MIPFVKLHGLGNDFVTLDGVTTPLPIADFPAFAQKVCDRRFSVGADGVLLLERGESAPLRMRMWNPDGSEAEMCGNGVRCAVRLAIERGHVADPEFTLETPAGPVTVAVLPDANVRVGMGHPKLRRGDIGVAGAPSAPYVDVPVMGDWRGTAVGMGNPHLVIFVPDVAAIDIEEAGPALERHPDFPGRTNVHFVQILDRGHLRQRTWERGAGVTLACGSGACAAAVAARVTDRADRTVEIDLPGGRLTITIGPEGDVELTGPATWVYEGERP